MCIVYWAPFACVCHTVSHLFGIFKDSDTFSIRHAWAASTTFYFGICFQSLSIPWIYFCAFDFVFLIRHRIFRFFGCLFTLYVLRSVVRFSQLVHALSIMASAATNSAKKYDPNRISLDHSSVCIGSWCPPICFGNKVNDLVDQRAQLGNQCFEISINVHNCSCSAVSPATDKSAFFSLHTLSYSLSNESEFASFGWRPLRPTVVVDFQSEIYRITTKNTRYSLFHAMNNGRKTRRRECYFSIFHSLCGLLNGVRLSFTERINRNELWWRSIYFFSDFSLSHAVGCLFCRSHTANWDIEIYERIFSGLTICSLFSYHFDRWWFVAAAANAAATAVATVCDFPLCVIQLMPSNKQWDKLTVSQNGSTDFFLSVLVTLLCRFNENTDECTRRMGKMCVCVFRPENSKRGSG